VTPGAQLAIVLAVARVRLRVAQKCVVKRTLPRLAFALALFALAGLRIVALDVEMDRTLSRVVAKLRTRNERACRSDSLRAAVAFLNGADVLGIRLGVAASLGPILAGPRAIETILPARVERRPASVISASSHPGKGSRPCNG
jgi:hypothetical protein